MMDRTTVESYIGKNVTLFWDEPASVLQVAHEGVAGGVITHIDSNRWVCLDWGYGVYIDAITRIEEDQTSPENEGKQ